jgi:hypothetical protein
VTVRQWALRRLMGRLRIDDDIVRHLSTFQRLGENVEVEMPGELLPVGARTVFRALRTRAAAQLGVDWVWPYWLQRQLDPATPAFVPRGHLPFLSNATQRNWTMVGNVASPWEAIVDPRGLVTPWFDGWSLDWWIGADDRWHFPSRETAVRQGLVGTAPVVETSMRIPSGDAVCRTYAVQGGDELVVVEVANRSPVPVALALAIRPFNPEGLAVVERVTLHDRLVSVDGRPALLLPQPPSRVAASTFFGGDVADVVVAGKAGTTFPSGLRDDAGLATAAFLFPLPHGATFRVAMPLVPTKRTRRRRLALRRAAAAPRLPDRLPTAEAVARAWDIQAGRGLRFVLPDARLADAVDANRKYLLLLHDGPEITPGPTTYHRFWFRDAAYMLAALDRYGYHAEVAEVISSYPGRQHVDGYFFSQRQEWDANGSALWSIAEHHRLTGDIEFVRELAPAVVKGVRWIERKRSSKKGRTDPALRGLMPASIAAEHLGPFDYFYWDSFWSLRGLLDGAELLDMVGQRGPARAARQEALQLRRAIDDSLALVAHRLGTEAIPAGPRRRIDSGVIGSLAACFPLGVLGPDDPRIAATVDVIRERFCQGPAFFQGISHTGLGTYLTLQLAFVELLAGDRRALERLTWMLGAASPTYAWPEAIHPQLGGGCMGDGHHGWAAADFLSFVRTLLVHEVAGERTIALCTLWPEEWLGQGLEVHDAPTHFGRLSFAVRWHGDRAALLWDLETRGGEPPRLTAPGLDPTWSSNEPKGEALLAPPMPVATPVQFRR